jgi:hypothetical protein
MYFLGKWLEISLPKGQAGGRAYEDKIKEHVLATAVTMNDWLAWILVAMLAKGIKWHGLRDSELRAGLKLYGIKVDEIERRAKALRKVSAGGKKKVEPEAAKDRDVSAANELANEEIAKRGILEESDAQRAATASIPAEPGEWVYGHELLEQLQPHLGGQHVEGRDWLSVLAAMPVRKSRANEFGVYEDFRCPEPLKWKGAKKRDGVNLKLALDEENGTWYVGYDHNAGDRSGGCLPRNTVGGFPTREQAIECGLRILCDVVKVGAVFNVLDELREVLRDACPVLSAQRTVDEAAEVEAKEVPETGKSKAMPEAEKLAWESYLETGSISEAAKACGLALDTVKNWHKRRKWKAMRAAEKGI